MGPEVLSKLLSGFETVRDHNLIVGFAGKDDAAVYRLSDDIAIIQTMDFFPPMVDDPYEFGRIAAANAISDVYAMGGVPLTGLNILSVPSCLPLIATRKILQGGYEIALQADLSVAGGHSIEDDSPLYGMSVLGVVHPDKIWRNTGAKPGDVLVLTKPIGSGVLASAVAGEELDETEEQALLDLMATLNRAPADIARDRLAVHACTDVTGFGLLGHIAEMTDDKAVTMELDVSKLPILPRSREFAKQGYVPAGAFRNRDFVGDKVEIADTVPRDVADILFDPQTSGGLLFALPEEDARTLITELERQNAFGAIVGKVIPYTGKQILVTGTPE